MNNRMMAGRPVPDSDARFLSIERVSKRFPVARDLLGRPTSHLSAVDRVSFSVPKGSTLALVGESGSGKSTLARLIVRLTKPTSGMMMLDGIDIFSAAGPIDRQLRRRIQIIFQDPYSSLDPRLRVEAIVGEGLHHASLKGPDRRARVGDLLMQVGLGRSAMRLFPHQLSGGQRQRVGIARALATEPELLVADEPVSALDGSIQGQVLNLLRDLQAERHLTIVFITHDLSVARYMADTIAVMHMGQIVELGPTSDIFDRPSHPYTRALLSAIPRYGRSAPDRIILSGDIPTPIDPEANCRFAGRCFARTDICKREEPALAPAAETDHTVACFNWRDLPMADSSESARRAGP